MANIDRHNVLAIVFESCSRKYYAGSVVNLGENLMSGLPMALFHALRALILIRRHNQCRPNISSRLGLALWHSVLEHSIEH